MAQLQYNAPKPTDPNKKPEDTEQSVGGAAPQPVNPFTNQVSTGQAPAASKFTNVSSYLNANKGAGEKIANKVQTGLQRDLEKVDKSKDETSGVAKQVQDEKNRLAAASGFNTQIKEDPMTIANNAGSLDAFKKLYTNQNIADSQQALASKALTGARSAVDAASANIGNLGTEQGRFALLDQNLNRPSYSQGQKRLDQLLFQVGGAKQLADAQQGLNSQLSSRDADLRKIANNLTGDINNNKTAAIKAAELLSGTTGTETTNLTKAQEEEARKLSADRGAFNAYMNKVFTSGVDEKADDPALLQKFKDSLEGRVNLNDRTYNALEGDKYKQYIQEGKTDLTDKDVLNADEYARYDALAKLAGLDDARRYFTSAGDAGPDSRVKSMELREGIWDSRRALENALNEQVMRAGDTTYVRDSSGDMFGIKPGGIQQGAGYNATADANLLSWLKQQEGGDPSLAANLNTYRNDYKLLDNVRVGANAQTGDAGIAGIDAPGTANNAVKKLWDEYQKRLMAGGYSNRLGGKK